MSDLFMTILFFAIVFMAVIAAIWIKRLLKAKPVTISEEWFYLNNENEKIYFNEIEAMRLQFKIDADLVGEGSTIEYRTNLLIKLHGVEQSLVLLETKQKHNFWAIIQACKKYNDFSNGQIHFFKTIPSSEEELEWFRKGWARGKMEIHNKVKELQTEDYAIERNISVEKAQKEIKQTEKKKRVKTLKTIAIIMLVLLIIALYNMVFI